MVTAKLGKIVPCQEKSFPFGVFINLSPSFTRRNELEISVLFSIMHCTPVGHTIFLTCLATRNHSQGFGIVSVHYCALLQITWVSSSPES